VKESVSASLLIDNYRTEGQKMRTGLIVLWMLLCSITSAAAQVSVGIGLPGVSIGINLPVYPQLVLVPGYPVYYAPQVNSNYFFYDGMYWVYAADNWYTSAWYNGPWELVTPEAVPLFVLRVPVRYYRRPPVYFHGWRSDAPPRWGEHWGDAWEQRRHGWDSWERSSAPPPAPLSVYQRQYSGTRYPRIEQQQVLQSQNYRYQPHDAAVQQHYQVPRVQSAPAPSPQVRQAVTKEKGSSRQYQRGSGEPSSVQQGAPPVPHAQSQRKGSGDVQDPATAYAPPQSGPTAQPQRQQSQQRAVQHEQKATMSQGQDNGPQGKGPAQEPRAQRQPQQPSQQAAAQHQQQSPRSRGENKEPQGPGAAHEPKQGSEKSHDKGEPQGGEPNK
jgi:hypothetical protein